MVLDTMTMISLVVSPERTTTFRMVVGLVPDPARVWTVELAAFSGVPCGCDKFPDESVDGAAGAASLDRDGHVGEARPPDGRVGAPRPTMAPSCAAAIRADAQAARSPHPSARLTLRAIVHLQDRSG
jgi:hypothetical protein